MDATVDARSDAHVKGQEKRDTYRAMKSALSRALKAGFYYEAVFIEYAIVEDRCGSALRHAEVDIIDKRLGKEIGLQQKLRKLRSHRAFTARDVRKRLPLELIDEVGVWKDERNALVHALAKLPYDDERVRLVAERGREVTRKLDNAVKKVNRYHDKARALEVSQVQGVTSESE